MGKKTSPSSMQDKKDTMETSYACIFPETFKMMNIFLVLLIGLLGGTIIWSFKNDKTRLCSRLSDCSVAQHTRISFVAPEIDACGDIHFFLSK